jgi:Fe-S cluster assembly scaffold protein SufB
MRWRVPLVNYSDIEKSSISFCSTNEITRAVYTAAVRDVIPIIYLDTDSEQQILEGMYDAIVLIVAADSTVVVHDMISARTKEFILLPNSACTYLYNQEKSVADTTATFYLGKGSTLNATYVGVGSLQHEHTLVTELYEKNASAQIQALYRFDGASSFAMRTMQHHTAPHTTSNLELRKIINDTGLCTYHGMIRIEKAAAQSDAAQNDRTLLLSPTARATSIPAIEVLTHDVQCAHGSALGTFDAEMLWYLQTRGIAIAAAQTMIYTAFFSESIDKIPHSFIREYAKNLFCIESNP